MKVCFGEWTLDPDTRQLLRKTEEVSLSPRAFDLLKLLVDNQPRALSKADLHKWLWPGTFVSEANLASLVAEIRRVLDDDAREPRYVRTVHRFGYAFCGRAAFDAGDHRAGAAGISYWLIWGTRKIPLVEGENILGREPEGHIWIDSPTVSRRHARIVIVKREATLEDLKSKNGTSVSGQPVSSSTPLADRDDISVGSEVLTFRMFEGPASTATYRSTEQRAPRRAPPRRS